MSVKNTDSSLITDYNNCLKYVTFQNHWFISYYIYSQVFTRITEI